jgi:uncharacterized glyoxalase superfamily protein PhnB
MSLRASAGSTASPTAGIEMAWQETFWAHGFGKVIDRFGVPWMVNVVKQA